MIHSILLLVNLLIAQPAQAEDSKYLINLGGSYGFQNRGFVRVREWETGGDKLDLNNDLGMDQFLGLHLSFGYRLGTGWIDLAHSEYMLDGEGNFANTFRYNGALYSAGKTDIEKTKFRRTSLTYRHVISGERNSLAYQTLGFGLQIESTKFYIDGDLDPSTTRTEKYESFDRQLVPVPLILASHHAPLVGRFGYGFEGSFAWLPKLKTWYQEGGRIYFAQTNFDLKGEITTQISPVTVALGYHYKSFHQKQSSNEDTNELYLTNSNIYLEGRWYF